MLKIAMFYIAYAYFGDEFLVKFAILLGSAPEDFRQKKIEDMFDFLDSKRNAGDSIVAFANGISEMMLEMVIGNSVRQLTNAVVSSASTTTNNKMNSIILYVCTLQPVEDGEKSFLLGGEEIGRDVISHYQEVAAECGIDMQVVFDFDGELVSEEKLGWEKVLND